ncbi:Catalyzes the hydroxylation of the N(6)-(4-aminobutyl)- L-lysine intermediate to form hypusine [Seminavis robusta]|uniref:Catalyzes the hydroxylation of the N(6)-(4-aminobutyl)- L-lysine intermediate to form hypusine n=1 Tax=Seminavis robusta TaxID=568900 RepID=A0A9N8EIT6_9STRA|nr:Catalyzes the hydroxylation of the N(6)-(4-aminobutyl)- L-lysine intermediate to form hypusine [Seminavis robusta]|eukprot:Sro1268_g257810.1 Catalyzes the hydroxylation of the N(6)-(4-aminobutyl)- L-lysine intermediate to form hypusine (479) ;mRNA; r:24243-25679
MMATVSGIESTPNPSSFLVRLSQPLSGMEDIEGLKGKTFTTATATGSSEIGDILAIDGVTSVYAMATPPALTIMKHVSGKWEEILPLVMAAIHTDQNTAEDDSILQSLLATVLDASKTNQQDTALRGQVRLRLQASYRIPIQIEASGFLGTTKRVKASSRFSQCMQDLIEAADTAEGSIAKIDFFANRKWMDQGVRYLDLEDDTGIDSSSLSEQDQEASDIDTVLAAELKNLDAAYSPERLASLVTKALRGDEKKTQQVKISVSPLDDDDFDATDLDLQKVDHYCDMADHGDMQALLILANFVASHDGEMAARRSALAFLGGTGDIVATTAAKKDRDNDIVDYGATVLDAVTSALQNEKNPIMRRTAGDALSDLGDDRAVPPACVALVEDKSKLVQWRAAQILGELGASLDVVGVLKQASFSDKYAFEVAFEIKDALRKVKERIQQQQQQTEAGSVNGAANTGTGPVWKQIQQGMDSS